MDFVKRNFLYSVLILAPLFFLSGCFIKTNSDKHWTLLTKKGNVWHVDKMIVTAVNVSNSPDFVERVDTILNPGNFIFEGSDYEASDCILKFVGNVKLHPDFSEHFGPLNANYSMVTSSVVADLNPSSYGSDINFDIVYLKGDKLRLYTPRELNPFITQIHDFNFTFECTRK
ncbi:MAG: hypothetical protein FGM14_01340 [Flavobacteriales bacterium]|nr:hypothetical protein [Flavobacteriales bacterium]